MFKYLEKICKFANISKMEKVIVIYGPTGVGKTKASIRLAKELNGEIISADSMQVYKGMDIGTAKITKVEMQGVKHHMLSIVSPRRDWTVYDFVTRAKECIRQIHERGKTAIIVGGTGLYLKALIENYDFSGVYKDSKIRKKYQDIAKKKGSEFLYNLLKEKCPERAENLFENDTFRIVRALEVLELKEKAQMEEKPKENTKSEFNFEIFALVDDREKLYKRINSRVNQMFKDGLKNEVKALLESGVSEKYPSMQGIGYKELISYFNKEIKINEAKELIKKRSRNYAKRQLTFLNSFDNYTKIQAGKNAVNDILSHLKEENNGNL